MSGASHLAAIYGSEQDKVNCSFYLKIGACRHGDRCSRKHIKPQYSQTLVIQNMYTNPAHANDSMSEEARKKHFDEFYDDVYCQLVKYGHLLEMHVCDNVGDHLIGNVYARYDWEDEAQAAVEDLNNQWYAGKPLFAELSPVTDFREGERSFYIIACCRQHEMGSCNRGGFCNFIHRSAPSPGMLSELEAQQRVERKLFPSAKDKEREAEMKIIGGGAPAPNGSDRGGDRDDRRRRRDDRDDRGDDRDSRRRRYD